MVQRQRADEESRRQRQIDSGVSKTTSELDETPKLNNVKQSKMLQPYKQNIDKKWI